MRNRLLCCFALLLVAACHKEPADVAFGTIEWDRVELVATASEPITAIVVREGDLIAANDIVLEQRADRAEAEHAAALSELERFRQLLAEQQAGARPQQKREAAARIERARAALKLAEAEQVRGTGLKARGLISTAELDRLVATTELARGEFAAARASADLLDAGTRSEVIAQTKASIAAAEQRAEVLRIVRDRLHQRAPVAGRVESLPFEVGDTPTLGATIATLLVGTRPYARVYLSPTLRARTRIGSQFTITVQGVDGEYLAKVRRLDAAASFTPYYALSGDDANRLAFLVELEFEGNTANNLASGLPVQAALRP